MKSPNAQNTSVMCPATISRQIELLRQKHIVTERDRSLERQLPRLFLVDEDGAVTHNPVRFARGTETRGIIFIEPAGGGKTTSITRTLGRSEALKMNPETELPRWLQYRVESPATLRSMGVSLLQSLGVETVSERAKVYDIWKVVRHRLKLMGITCLWIDEAHDLFRGDGSAETNDMFKMLKGLMQGAHAVVLILSGTERLANVTQLDPQINRRFNKICPEALDAVGDIDRVKALVDLYADDVGIEVSLSRDTLQRLIVGARFRFGRCVELIIEAIECALHRGADQLDVGDFQEAWSIREGGALSDNLFFVRDWQKLSLPEESQGFDPYKPSARKGGR